MSQKMLSGILGCLAFLVLLVLAGCAKQAETPVCTSECAFTGVQCVKDGFYTCADTNNDKCMEKVLVESCGEGWSCENAAKCTSATEDGVIEFKTLEELKQKGVNANLEVPYAGYTYHEEGRVCTVGKEYYGEGAVVRCFGSAPTDDKFKLECTSNCERGLSVTSQGYKMVTGDRQPYQLMVALRNANARKCGMTCDVLLGVGVPEGKIMITNGATETVLLKTDTPNAMQLLCSEVKVAGTECNDNIRQVFTAKWAGTAKTVEA